MRVISIDAVPAQGGKARNKRQSTERKWNYADSVRAVRLFYGEMTIAKIAARERVGYNFIEDLVRQYSRPEFSPFPLAARLTRRAS